MSTRKPRYSAKLPHRRGWASVPRTWRLVGVIAAVVAVVVLVIYLIVRPTHDDSTRQAANERVESLSSQPWLAVEIDYRGYTSRGTYHDGVFAGESEMASGKTVPVVATGTDTYIQAAKDTWSALGIAGDVQGWVNTGTQGTVPTHFVPSLDDLRGQVVDRGECSVSDNDVLCPDYRVSVLNDDGLRVSSEAGVVSYKRGAEDDSMAAMVSEAKATQARVVAQNNGQLRIDAPAPLEQPAPPAPPAPPAR